MNGAASIHRLHSPNRCKCGHEYYAHNLTVTPQVCTQCLRNPGGAYNEHNFTAWDEPWPSTAFPQPPPARYYCAGGFGTAQSATAYFDATLEYNQVGATTLYFASSVPTLNTFRALAVGMTLSTVAANPAQQHSYVIQSFTTSDPGPTVFSITIAPPGLIRALSTATVGVVCLFAGALGSTMGPGLPPNGQRAG